MHRRPHGCRVDAVLEAIAFLTLDDAAVHALTLAKQTCDLRYECGGVIRQTREGYVVSPLVSSQKPFNLDLREPYGDGVDVVADFHTHICSVHNLPFAAFFSTTDADVDDGLHIRGYMLDLCTGNIHRYIPGEDDRDDEEVDFKPHQDGSRLVIYLTIGHIIGWVK